MKRDLANSPVRSVLTAVVAHVIGWKSFFAILAFCFGVLTIPANLLASSPEPRFSHNAILGSAVIISFGCFADGKVNRWLIVVLLFGCCAYSLLP